MITGLYATAFNENKPLPLIVGRDRIGLLLLRKPDEEAFFRELDQEVGTAETLAAYGSELKGKFGGEERRDYPLFGPRFSRTVVPLAEPDDAQEFGLRRPLPWSNDRLLSTYSPSFLAVAGSGSGAKRVGDVMPGRCFDLPLRRAKPAVRWELWRCDDRDPRSRVQNGDFSSWQRGAGPFEGRSGGPATETADGWLASAVSGAGFRVSRLVPPAGDQEPFRLSLEYRGPTGGAELSQSIPAEADLRELALVVDARVQASRTRAATLIVDDGTHISRMSNRTTDPETLRVTHRIDARATSLRVALAVSSTGQDTRIVVRSILAIPRSDEDSEGLAATATRS